VSRRSEGAAESAPLVYVDAENVRRSLWPNIPRDELVRLVEAWGEREGVRPVVVFEGEETADDRIAREAAQLAEPYWLITSDRGLRERAGGRAERLQSIIRSQGSRSSHRECFLLAAGGVPGRVAPDNLANSPQTFADGAM
jgi:hypothetical protein